LIRVELNFISGLSNTISLHDFVLNLDEKNNRSNGTDDDSKEIQDLWAENEDSNQDYLLGFHMVTEQEFRDIRYSHQRFTSYFHRLIQQQITGQGKHFAPIPILLLSSCDFAELVPSVLNLLHNHNFSLEIKPVVIFAPHFLHETVLIELKLAFDRWKRGDYYYSAEYVALFRTPLPVGLDTLSQRNSFRSFQFLNPAPSTMLPAFPVEQYQGGHVRSVSLSSPKGSERTSSRSRASSLEVIESMNHSSVSRQPQLSTFRSKSPRESVVQQLHSGSNTRTHSDLSQVITDNSLQLSSSSATSSTPAYPSNGFNLSWSALRKSSSSSSGHVSNRSVPSLQPSHHSTSFQFLNTSFFGSNINASSAQNNSETGEDESSCICVDDPHHVILQVLEQIQKTHSVAIPIFI
jgi:hypothetical protein